MKRFLALAILAATAVACVPPQASSISIVRADDPSDPVCAVVRELVDGPYADASYHDGTWHFPNGSMVVTPEEDSCWSEER